MSSQTMLYNSLSNDSNIQVIIPNQALREFLNYIKIFTVVITLIASVSVIISIIMLFITMLTSSIEQRKDTSILRALGASRGTIFNINICQMLVLAVIGVILGCILSHIVIAIIGNYIVVNYGLYMSGLVFLKEEFIAMAITIVLALLAGIIPALMVYKTDATKYLK
jgi:putative ABC transport system permease protein